MKIEKNKLVKVNYISEEFIGKFFIKNVEGSNLKYNKSLWIYAQRKK